MEHYDSPQQAIEHLFPSVSFKNESSTRIPFLSFTSFVSFLSFFILTSLKGDVLLPYFESLARERNFDPLVPDNWYSQKVSLLIELLYYYYYIKLLNYIKLMYYFIIISLLLVE